MPTILDLTPEKRFQILVDGVVDYALFLLDPDGHIASWNSGAERIKGYLADEVLGKHFSIFYTPEDRQRLVPQNALRTALEKGKYEAEGWRLRKDGTKFWASVVIDALRSEKGEHLGFAKITRDVTERRSNELRLAEAREQLIQSQKMESIGQLTGGIAHDFNNLLTVILSGTNMLERQMEENPRATAVLGNIRHAVQRGEKLTRQLLSYSRRQALKPELLDLATSLRSFSEGILQALRSNIEVELEVPGDLQAVEADPSELDLALINLALNARDAMASGGKLRIKARNEVRTIKGDSSSFVAISISDTGIGMSPDTTSRATEPFFTTKPPGVGTGLGLSQALGFANQSGGSLQIDSVLGRGTTVTIYLPAAGASISEQPAAATSRGLRVLVVEDEALVAEMARTILSHAGYNVEVAYNASKGLEIIRSGEIDAVFSDIVMPGGMTGLDLADVVRSEFPAVPVLLTSGYYQLPSDRVAMHEVLRKPYDETQLLTALDSVITSAK
jgi:PAS domain S-box-containing protein